MIGALTAYGMWMKSNDAKDEIFELICLILIGLLFLFSFYHWIVLHRSVSYQGLSIFLSFVVVTVVTMIKSKVQIDTRSRNWALGLGLGSMVPILCIIASDYLLNEPIPINMD